MPFGEIILTAIADAVFGYVIDKHGDKLGDWARDKMGRDPIKKAFKGALSKTIIQFEQRYPQWIADYFDASFFEHQGAPVLAQFLVRNGHPDPGELAALWADSLNIHRPERRSYYTRELEPVASNFLTLLAHHLKTQKALRELQDSSAFEQLAEDVRAIGQRLGADQATYGTRRDYLRWMIARNLYIDTRGTFQVQRQVQVKLDEVYISLYAKNEVLHDSVDLIFYDASGEAYVGEFKNDAGTDESIAAWMENSRLLDSSKFARFPIRSAAIFYQMRGRLERAGAKSEYLLSLKDYPSLDWIDEVLDLNTVINRHDRLIIQGDPGSGKTTLLHFLALKHAQALYDGLKEASPELGTARFPILIRISEYIENGAWKEHPLSEFLAKSCVLHECPTGGLEDLMRLELEKGNCFILLDGLDEVVSTDERRGVVRRIEDFVRRYAEKANRFVITSRIAGYSSAPLGESFTHYMIVEMREAQIQLFLERWCQAVEDAQTPDLPPEQRMQIAQREIAGIMKAMQDSPGVQRLAANPLLLRTIALIHRTGAQLPHQRIELYKLAADTLARTWRTAQGVPESALVEERYLTRLLSKLAYWLHANKSTGIASEQEIFRELGQEWARLKGLSWDEDNLEIEGEVEKFLGKVREHTGLVIERAPKQYSFMHLTFEEYFVARYLVARSKDRATLIHQHLHDPRWEEPILLALGFVGLDSPEDAAELLEVSVLAQGTDAKELGLFPSRYEELLGRDYLFALRCLGDNIPVRPRKMQQLLERLVGELLHDAGPAKFSRYRQALSKRLEYLKESEAASALLSPFMKSLLDSDLSVRLEAARSLGSLGQTAPEVLTALAEVLGDSDPAMRDAAARSLGQLSTTSPVALETLVKALHDAKPEMRNAAARGLGLSGQATPKILAALINVLQTAEPGVAYQAAWSLGRLGPASVEVLAALIEALQGANSHVREVAAGSLGQFSQMSSEVLAPLIESLHDPDFNIRNAAIWSLGHLGQATPEVVTALIEVLQDDSPFVRHMGVRQLGRLGRATPEVVTALIEALRDPTNYVRTTVTGSLGQLGQTNAEVIATLIETLHSTDQRLRNGAARSLGLAGQATPEVIDALMATLHDTDLYVQIAAVRSLGQLSYSTVPDKIIPPLLSALHDKNTRVRHAAAESLGRLEQTSSEIKSVQLKALSKANNWSIRSNIALFLGQSGQSDESTIEALLRGLPDGNKNVSLACAQALAQLALRFPQILEIIEGKLVQIIEDPKFDKPDSSRERPANDIAYDALWLLEVGGEIEEV